MELSNEELPSRWEIELEFVQSLANTQYLTYLAQSGYFKDESFLNYLNYLNYWKKPDFAKFLVYPDCLHILTLLQNENFRNEILNPNFTNLLYNDMMEYWKEPLYKDEKEREHEKDLEEEKKSKSISNSLSANSSTSPDLKNLNKQIQKIEDEKQSDNSNDLPSVEPLKSLDSIKSSENLIEQNQQQTSFESSKNDQPDQSPTKLPVV